MFLGSLITTAKKIKSVIIHQVRMLESNWLVSHVVLYHMDGKLIPHGQQIAGRLKTIAMFVFWTRHRVIFLPHRENCSSHTKILIFSEYVEKTTSITFGICQIHKAHWRELTSLLTNCISPMLKVLCKKFNIYHIRYTRATTLDLFLDPLMSSLVQPRTIN